MNKQQLKQLQKKWYKKLKDTGFNDIEDTDSVNEMLKTWDSHYFIYVTTPEQFQARSDYYDRCSTFLNEHKFLTKLDKKIWELHSEGIPLRTAAKQVNKSVAFVFKATRRLRAAMNGVVVRKATEADMNFVYSTWLKGVYHGSDLLKNVKRAVYFENYPKYIAAVLARPTVEVKVAALAEDKDVILGYAVVQPGVVHWVYVKSAWRKQNVAKTLLAGYNIQESSSMTKIGASIMKKKKIQYNPWS